MKKRATVAARDYRLKSIKNQPKIRQKSPQVVKHAVKGEKWACSTPKAGKNKPVMFITETREFARICEKTKEKRGFVMNPRFGGFVMNPRFGMSDKT